jgi:hypothetical protein
MHSFYHTRHLQTPIPLLPSVSASVSQIGLIGLIRLVIVITTIDLFIYPRLLTSFASICSVSDLLDYINPDDERKEKEMQRKHRRVKVIFFFFKRTF